jgi:hypothetical protein
VDALYHFSGMLQQFNLVAVKAFRIALTPEDVNQFRPTLNNMDMSAPISPRTRTARVEVTNVPQNTPQITQAHHQVIPNIGEEWNGANG